MQSTRRLELGVGLFAVLGLGALLMLSMKVSNLSHIFAETGYLVTARFQNIGGLKVKSPVKMAGVRIGRVVAIQLDEQAYQALVTLEIEANYTKIPIDTKASIFTAGLLGEQYIGLKEGYEESYLTENGEIFITQPALVLEQLIGQFLLSFASPGQEAKP